MKTTKMLALALTFALSFALAACSGAPQNSSQTPATLPATIDELPPSADPADELSSSESGLSDTEIIAMTDKLMQEGQTVFWWYLGDYPDALDLDTNEDNWVQGDWQLYAKVGRFKTMAELKSATESIFTLEFCETHFYDKINDYQKFHEIDGVLYHNLQSGGMGWILALPKEYVVKTVGSDTIVLTAIGDGLDARPGAEGETEYEFEITLKNIGGTWKLNNWYNYVPTGEEEVEISYRDEATSSPLNSSQNLIDYEISSGTYANGDAPFDDIPFIKYSVSVPSDWTAEESGYWGNEEYYTFHKDDLTNLYAGESYRKDYMDETSLSLDDIITLEFGDYIVKLMLVEDDDGWRYSFFIPVENSYCRITGRSLEYSQEQQNEFFDIVKTFEVVEQTAVNENGSVTVANALTPPNGVIDVNDDGDKITMNCGNLLADIVAFYDTATKQFGASGQGEYVDDKNWKWAGTYDDGKDLLINVTYNADSATFDIEVDY